jgi:uncharacterized membrane protein HdeD (DUF308 family)
MFEVRREHARFIGYLSWGLVGVAVGAMLFGIMPTREGFEAALVSLLAVIGVRFTARWEGRSE